MKAWKSKLKKTQEEISNSERLSFLKSQNQLVLSMVRSNADNCRFGLYFSDCENVEQKDSRFYQSLR